MEIKHTPSLGGEGFQGVSSGKRKGEPEARPAVVVNGRGDNGSFDVVGAKQVSDVRKNDIARAVSDLNRYFQIERRNLSFSVNEKTKDIIIQVKDAETDEVIKQIPPEYVINLAEHLAELAEDRDALGGLLLKDQA